MNVKFCTGKIKYLSREYGSGYLNNQTHAGVRVDSVFVSCVRYMISKMHIPDILNSKTAFVLMFKNILEADRSD